MPPPLPSPGRPYPVDRDEEPATGEHTIAGAAPARATPEYVDQWAERFKRYLALGAAIGGLATGGGVTYSHFSATDHADKAVNERTAALEAKHSELGRRIEKVESRLDTLDQHQTDAEIAAERRQAELLEAIKGKKR